MGYLDFPISNRQSKKLERKADKLLKSAIKGKKSKKKRLGKKILPFERPKYKEYIKSAAWRARRKEYYDKHPKQCVACKSKRKIGLHHLTYENLGRERDEDLVALCWVCHEGYHNEHGVRKDNNATHDFISEKQQLDEFAEIVKHLR